MGILRALLGGDRTKIELNRSIGGVGAALCGVFILLLDFRVVEKGKAEGESTTSNPE